MKLATLFSLALMAIFAVAASGDEKEAKKKNVPKSLQFKMKSIDGKQVDLAKYNGKVLVIVNVASQ